MMNDILVLILALMAGAVLAAFFFGGLWWTIRKGATAKYPALLFLGSILLRTGVVLAGFFLVSGGHWQKLLACLVGFVLLRFWALHYFRPPLIDPAESAVKETTT